MSADSVFTKVTVRTGKSVSFKSQVRAGGMTYLFMPSMHRAPCWHGWSLHSSTSTSHWSPWKPAVHVQEKPLTLSWQRPPLRQGCDWHSSIWTSQLTPAHIREWGGRGGGGLCSVKLDSYFLMFTWTASSSNTIWTTQSWTKRTEGKI